jgi:hypothetical protein
MFLPSPKPLISILVKPVLPTWVLVAALAAQYAITSIGSPPKPDCTLKVHYPHYSTSMERRESVDSIKVNITSECTVPQEFTEVTAQITEVVNGVTADYPFESVRQNADPENSHNASFKNLWKACTKGSESLYIGSAHGFVRLKSGEEIKVSNSSGKYHPEKCRIKTK